ncbi:MAG: CSLREA domain-containing protein [Anaerolineales bacterium]|nr:CSLREA domain-containing protein [Anaerolineales bacterium]
MKTLRSTCRFLFLFALLFSWLSPPTLTQAASLTVNTLTDTIAADGLCTLREAIVNANRDEAKYADCAAGSGADTITFGLSGTILLGSSLPTVDDPDGLTIDGAGQSVTISGGDAYRVIHSSDTLVINHLTIADGYAALGLSGGGIYHCCDGTLTILNSTFTGNRAVQAGSGGGVYNYWGTLTIINSTFFDNHVNGAGGGVFGNHADVIIANSTFSGNSAQTEGGGAIYNEGGDFFITNSTISGNSAGLYSGGIQNTWNATSTLTNTVLSNNTFKNCHDGVFINGGHNLEDGASCGWGSNDGSLSGSNPLLGALTGSPAYFPLLNGSPAIDAGDDIACAAPPISNQSQNGVPRPQWTHCDIGSYEYVDAIPPLVQSITRLDPNPTSATSLRFTVTFAEAVTGVDLSDFTLSVTGVTGASILSLSGGPKVYTVLVDTGSGAGTIRLDVLDDDTVLDTWLHPLGGAGAGNGSYTDGEVYDVLAYRNFLPLTLRSGDTSNKVLGWGLFWISHRFLTKMALITLNGQ